MVIFEFLIGLGWRTWLWGSIITLSLGVAAWFTHDIYTKGYNASQKAINDANTQERSKADDAQKDVDACYAAGRVWDRAGNKCM